MREAFPRHGDFLEGLRAGWEGRRKEEAGVLAPEEVLTPAAEGSAGPEAAPTCFLCALFGIRVRPLNRYANGDVIPLGGLAVGGTWRF